MSNSNFSYSLHNYWNSRYQNIYYPFDWLEDYESLKSYLEKKKKNFQDYPNIKILNIGCGTSELSEKIYTNLNIKNISNIDFSDKCISIMNERNKEFKEMEFKVMDALSLNYENNTFDLIIDKCLLDCLFCNEFPFTNCAKYFKEVQRVLKDNGVFFLVSHSDINNREVNFSNLEFLNFEIKQFVIENKFEIDRMNIPEIKRNYLYICKKINSSKFTNELYENILKILKEKEEILIQK